MLARLLSLMLVLFTACSSSYTPAQNPHTVRPNFARTLPQNPQVSMVDLNSLGWRSGMDNGVLIVLDPGHGGDDYGTNSNGTPKFYEKFLNLSTAQLVKGLLEQRGYRVEMTRTDDTFITLDDRATVANKLGAKIFVSIHYNSAPSEKAEGLEVFYYEDKDSTSRLTQSKLLARSALDQIVKLTGVKSRGVKSGNFAVIRKTEMPAILIEGGFLTNDAEMEKIKTGSYQKLLAQGIARGIIEYLAKAQLSQ